MTNVRVLNDKHVIVTREATKDQWDRDDTDTSHSVQSIEVVSERAYLDLTVDFEVEAGGQYYLLYGVYSTGDSFGRDVDAGIDYVDLFQSKEVADENLKRLEANSREVTSTVKLVTEQGLEYNYSVPWKGYFERLSYVEVLQVSAGYKRRIVL